MSAHMPGDLVVEPETRHEHQEQTFKVVSLAEKKANEWRQNWYWPSVLHGLTRAQADLFSAAPDMLAVLEDALPFLQDHAEEVRDLAASWPENPDGDGAAKTAQTRVERARAAIAKARGK